MPVDFNAAVAQETARLEALHPTPGDIPGCFSIIDEFMRCHTPGAQLKSFYRYGTISECKEKLQDFKFCASLRSLEPEDKRKAWIRRRAEWWATRRCTKSSEDVWDIRDKPPPSETILPGSGHDFTL